MKKPVAPPVDPAVLAVIHRAGSSWRGLVANTRGVKPSVVATREFSADKVDQIDHWLSEQHAGLVLCVLPAAQAICRTVPLPDAPAEQLEPALRLQAEAHLLGIAPPHRLAMAVLPGDVGESTRSGLILAWPDAAEFRAPVTSHFVRYIPDAACLAAILNGTRPVSPILWLDRGDGSVALALTHSGGLTFRATREEPADLASWQRSIGRIVAETALNAGHSGAFVEQIASQSAASASSIAPDAAVLVLPEDIRAAAHARLAASRDDAQWWNNYGIAAGAVLAHTGPLASLARLQHSPPTEAPSRIRSLLEACSRPRTSAWIVIASLLLLMFAPLAFSGMRLLALKVRYGDVADQLIVARASRDQVAVYKELDRQHIWPMTKLLSDIATNAPLGIELDVMRLDAGKDFAVSGTAIARDGKTPPEIVAQMSANLRAEAIFNNLSLSIGDANNLGVYQFDITGKVNSAARFRPPRYPPERDFLAWDAVARRDGTPVPTGSPSSPGAQPETPILASGATDTPPSPLVEDTESGAPTDTDVDPDSDSPSELASAGEDGDAASGRRPANRPSLSSSTAGMDPTQVTSGAPPAGQIPPPLTKEEIEAMSQAELQQALARVSKARPYARNDAELDSRLKDEFNQLMAQLRKVKGSA